MPATNPPAFDPSTTVSTAELAGNTVLAAPSATAHEGAQIPLPFGTTPQAATEEHQGTSTDPTAGIGMEGEETVWEARYSYRNFIGRAIALVVLSLGAGWLAYTYWGGERGSVNMVGKIVGGVMLAAWIWLGLRIFQARLSHHYRLTTRRLFVATGIVQRRRDQMELLRVKDVFDRQLSLLERLLGVGTVVVVSDVKELPTFYLAGVDDPKRVMDLIWHHARAERDQRSVKVDSV